MKLLRLNLLTIVILFPVLMIFPQQDASKLQDIIAMRSSAAKIEALNIFKSDYPSSSYLNRANLELFYTYVELKNPDSALYYGDKYLATLTPLNKTPYYNRMAYELADKGIGLDTALVYSGRAIELAKDNPRYANMYKDTRAFVLYKRGDVPGALALQKEAIEGNEDDPECNYHLALYMLESGHAEGFKYAAAAVMLGDPVRPVELIKLWGPKSDKDLLVNAVNEIINLSMAGLTGDELLAARSNAAAFMAQAGVNPDTAVSWARAAVKSITPKTSIENLTLYKKNLGIVMESLKKYDEALLLLKEIEEFVDPWSTDYWVALGRLYRHNNNNDKALQAYASSLVAYESEPVMKAASEIASQEEIDRSISEKRDELLNMKHEEYKDEYKNGRAVLAELFTGAECPPCVAADNAFDALAEYYPRQSLVILEYHVHIPGPDPLTNPKTFQRYQWYGGNFGTPTAFFQGTEQFIGGGPKLITKNRFSIYKHAVTKYLKENPLVSISGESALKGTLVNIRVKVDKNTSLPGKAILNIALVEKSVNYTGANGVSKHIFVVRDLLYGSSGKELSESGNNSFENTVDVSALKDSISRYLTDPSKELSWRSPQFTGWRKPVNELDKIDEKNLAVVAWVQNPETREVLQAKYFDVK